MIALSGGGDSTALLHLLHEVRDERALQLTAAHFDHALRADSAREARLVASRARSLDVPCRVGRAGPGLGADQASLRRARYRFLEEVAEAAGADRVATGHQADDQAETVLFRLLRGTGLGGLAGIPERRGPYVRPLLPFRRSELRAWLEARGAPHLEDPSNRDPRWARARIRRSLLPAAEAAWGGPLTERLREVAGAARRADRALDARAETVLRTARRETPGAGWDEAVALDRPELLKAPAEIRGRAVRLLADRLGVAMTGGGTRQAIQFISEGRSGGRVSLGGGIVLAREFDRLVLGRAATDRPDTILTLGSPREGSGRLYVGGRRVELRWGLPPEADTGPTAGRVELARERLDFPLRLRSWRDGDRLRTAAGTRKLKELFREARVPESRRSRLVVATDASGRVVWVEGIGRDVSLAPVDRGHAFSLRVRDV